MGVGLLELSNNSNLCTNMRQVSFDYGFKLNAENNSDLTNNNYLAIAPTTSSPSSEISLPPVNSLMKHQIQSPSCNIDFDNLILMAKNEEMPAVNYQIDYLDSYQLSLNDAEKSNQSKSPPSIKQIKFTEVNEIETQKYACELCARKYITKSNLEKHMRSHDLFMCVVCMKMFQNPDELKEHDCFKQKSSAKKSLFHCGICWKVLSNSWSLNRHMKIHRNVTVTPDISSQEK
jgi:Zinc finger, C2H2 type